MLAEIKAARAAFDGPRLGDYVYFTKTGQLERISHNLGKTLQTSPAGSFCIHKNAATSFSGSLNPGTPLLRLKPSVATLPGKFWFFHHGISGPHRAVDVEIDCRVYVTSAKFEGFIVETVQADDAIALSMDIERQIMDAKRTEKRART